MTSFCQRCGAPASETGRFCGTCGNPVSATDTTPPVAERPVAAPATDPAAAPAMDPFAPPSSPVAEAATAPTGPSPEMTARLDATYKRVGDFLRAAEIKFFENTAERSYTAMYGSAVSIVKVVPAGPDDTWVAFLAPVVMGADLRPDLLEYLLRKNAEWTATKFHVTPANEIWLQYSVLGSILDANTCKVAVVFMMLTADAEDDAIRTKWGGKRASEVLFGATA